MPAKTKSEPLLDDGNYIVKKVNELNFFDLSGKKAKTSGTSNKMYHAELQIAKDNSGKAQVFTMYGPTGSVQKKEWRHYTSESDAEKEYEKILKSKRKKGYKDIDVAQRAYGSDDAKTITKTVQLKNLDSVKPVKSTSQLTEGQKKIVEIFFGSQAKFVATTLKCPLGQLTNQQIDDGRHCLDQAKNIVNAAKKRANKNNSKTDGLTKKDREKLLDLTNDFYGLIPHNFGAGSRGQMSHLLLDSLDKIMAKEDDLDTLLDAKSVGAQLKGDDSLDAQYRTLNADIEMLDHNDPMFKFLSMYFMQTKVRGHGYHNAKVINIWKMCRKDGELNTFINNSERIAKQCGKHTFIKETNYLSGGCSAQWAPNERPDLDKKEVELYNAANVWLCWHGTRSANLVGITTRGLLIRPSGAIHTGSMFGDGCYFAWQATKSLNYCDGGYWTGNRSKNISKFMFLLDTALGNMYTAPRPSFYKGPPNGYHSVYGKANHSGVMNDEMITYDFNKIDKQSCIRYLFEIKA